jgi:hypothetical protein
VREFCDFPKGKYSDQVDATTQLLDHAGEFTNTAHFKSGESAIAACSSGQVVNFARSQGRERGIAAGALYGRPIGSGVPQGPIFSIKTEVKY